MIDTVVVPVSECLKTKANRWILDEVIVGRPVTNNGYLVDMIL